MTEYYELIAGLLIAFVSCVITMRCRPSNTQKWFMLTAISTLGYMLSELFVLHSDSTAIFMLGKAFKFSSLLWMNVSILFGLYEVCDVTIGRKLKNILFGLIFLLTALCLSIVWHKACYSSVELIPIEGAPGLFRDEPVEEWLYYVLNVYNFLLLAFIIFYMLVKILRKKGRKMRIIRIVCLIPAIHVAMLLLHVLDLFDGAILNHLAYILQNILVIVLMVRYDATVTTPQIKDKAVEYAANGIVILDSGYHYAYANDSAKKLLPRLNDENPDAVTDYVRNQLTGEDSMRIGERHYAVLMEEERDEAGHKCGYLITLNDITEQEKRIRAEEELKTAAEREKFAAEMDLAVSIQRSTLPSDFPAFPGRTEFEIFASMDPAKYVGGDFYDFFLLPGNRLCVLIADVSGKGVPAALFMMTVRTMLEGVAQGPRSPAEVLDFVNAQICEKNPEDMFVTVWLGFLELDTGRLLWSNAGHDPLAAYQDGVWKLLPRGGGVALGFLEPEFLDPDTFTDHELLLKPGDAVFQYTDGVTEAMTDNLEQFGYERLLAALSGSPSPDPETMLPHVRAEIDAFTQGAPQFDDITMLGLRYRGNKQNMTET